MLSWPVLALGVGAFVCAAKFPNKVPMSALVLMGAIGIAFISVLISVLGLAVTAGSRDLWRPWAILTLGIELVSSLSLAGIFLYAFFHLPVH